MINSVDAGRPPAGRFAEGVMVLFILSIYLLETESTANYFQLAQVLMLVTAVWIVLSRGWINTHLISLWFTGLVAAGALATIMNQTGVSLEFRTFLVNGLLAMAFLQFLSSERRIALAIKSFGVAGLLASFSLLATFDPSTAASTSVDGAWAIRLGSTLPGANPNIAGMYLAIAFSAALSRALARSSSGWIRLAWLAITGVILLGVTVTGSRKAILYCVLAALVLVAFYSLRLLPILAGAGAILTWALLNVEWLFVVVGHRLVGLGDVMETDAIRAQAVSDALEAFMRSPFGTGWGSSGRFLSGLHYTHSNYLEVLVSLGVVGLLIYYYAHLRILLGIRRMTPAIGPAVAALMVAGLAMDVVQVTYLYKAPLLVIALGVGALYTSRDAAGAVSLADPPRSGGAPKSSSLSATNAESRSLLARSGEKAL